MTEMYGRISEESNKETIPVDGCRPHNALDTTLQLNDYKILYNVSGVGQ